MDVFLRKIDEGAVKHIDEIAKRQGKSRNEFLKDYLELLAAYPAIIQREDRLEKFLHECETKMFAMTMALDMFTDLIREIAGLEDDEDKEGGERNE